MFRQEKRLNPFRIKPLYFKTWHILRWRQLNKINKLLFINNKNIIKKLGIQTGIQIMCCWAVSCRVWWGKGESNSGFKLARTPTLFFNSLALQQLFAVFFRFLFLVERKT
jgi:hypothetical protein